MMKLPTDFDRALHHLCALQDILEPNGGTPDWEEQPRDRVRAFMRAASAVAWCCAMSVESMLDALEERKESQCVERRKLA